MAYTSDNDLEGSTSSSGQQPNSSDSEPCSSITEQSTLKFFEHKHENKQEYEHDFESDYEHEIIGTPTVNEQQPISSYVKSFHFSLFFFVNDKYYSQLEFICLIFTTSSTWFYTTAMRR